MTNSSSEAILQLTADIVSAHVGHNAVPGETLPVLIRSVFATLAGTSQTPVVPAKPEPAVPVKKSVLRTTSSASKTAKR